MNTPSSTNARPIHKALDNPSVVDVGCDAFTTLVGLYLINIKPINIDIDANNKPMIHVIITKTAERPDEDEDDEGINGAKEGGDGGEGGEGGEG